MSADPSVVTATEEHIAEYISQTLADGPRRFALFGVAPDRRDAGLIGWGLAFDDEAIFYTVGNAVIRAQSAESVHAMMRRKGDTRLAWLDAETPAPVGAAADAPEAAADLEAAREAVAEWHADGHRTHPLSAVRAEPDES